MFYGIDHEWYHQCIVLYGWWCYLILQIHRALGAAITTCDLHSSSPWWGWFLVKHFSFSPRLTCVHAWVKPILVVELAQHLRKWTRLVWVQNGYVHVFFLDSYESNGVVTWESRQVSYKTCQTQAVIFRHAELLKNDSSYVSILVTR